VVRTALGFGHVVKLEKKREELKERLLQRFTEEQLMTVAEEMGFKSVEELKEALTFEDAIELARKYKIPWADLYLELEEYKRKLLTEQ
jgi:hypothetical protein